MSSDDEDIRKLIGSRIAIARKAAGLNQEELAAAVGVHKQTISRYERGVLVPDANEICAMVSTLNGAAIVGVPIAILGALLAVGARGRK